MVGRFVPGAAPRNLDARVAPAADAGWSPRPERRARRPERKSVDVRAFPDRLADSNRCPPHHLGPGTRWRRNQSTVTASTCAAWAVYGAGSRPGSSASGCPPGSARAPYARMSVPRAPGAALRQAGGNPPRRRARRRPATPRGPAGRSRGHGGRGRGAPRPRAPARSTRSGSPINARHAPLRWSP